MRIAALAAPDVVQGIQTEAGATIGEITLGGTIFLLVFAGVGSALAGTAFYLASRPWLPRRRSVRALAFGGLELAVFGTIVLDAGNRDFTILGRPLLNVAVFGSLFVLHGALLVLLIEPSGRMVARAAGGRRWRGAIVDAASAVAAALTVLTAIQLGVQADGARWHGLVMLTLVACALGLAFVHPDRARPLTRPAFKAVGAVAITVIAVTGAAQLLDAVRTIPA